jgi:hypothetical protein
MRLADAGIAELQRYVDTLIVIPNQNLFRVANENGPPSPTPSAWPTRSCYSGVALRSPT